jgi:prepilin signal peptidase PulO-like enzyme (type II secretory pathway)
MINFFAQAPLPNNLPTGGVSQSTVQTGIDFILQLAGALAVIFIIIGAVKFSTSGGDPQKVASARQTVIYAIIGLIVAVSAFTIASIVGEEASAVSGDPFFGSNGIITSVFNWLGWVVGVASVIGIIYGGLRYITSAGNPQSAQAGRNAVIYSIVGLIVALTAGALVSFVLEKL